MKETKLLKGLLKSQRNITISTLVIFLITGNIGYSAEEINPLTNNNSIEIAGNNNFSTSNDLDILNVGQNDLSKLWGIKNLGTGNVNIKNVNIDVSTGDNTIDTEVKGIWSNPGNFSAKDINLTLNNNTNSSTWGIEKTDGDFKANDITMNISAKTGEIYGIINAGTSNAPSNFSAQNIKIVGHNENGDFIGITNKFGNSNFSANNIFIDGTAKGFMVGIENLTTNELKNLNDVTIKLNGQGTITGISSASSNFIANNLTMKIDGNSTLVRGVDGVAIINGNTHLELTGGSQDVYGFRKKATLNGKNNIIKINSSKTTNYLSAFYDDSTFGNNSTTNIDMNVKNNTDSIIYAISNYGKVELGNNSTLNINIDGTGTKVDISNGTKYQGGIFGILSNSGVSDLSETSQTNVTVQGAGVNDAGYFGTVGIGGSVKAAGDVKVDVLSKDGIALRAASRDEKQLYTGNTIINAENGYAIGLVDISNGRSAEVKINPNTNKIVQLTGDLKHFTTDTTASSLIDVSLKTEDSFFTGASTGINSEKNRKTNLSFENNSKWNVTANSVVSRLSLNKGTVNLAHKGNHQKLEVENMLGNEGTIIMNISSSDTDQLSGKTDFINIKTADSEQTHYIKTDKVSTSDLSKYDFSKKILIGSTDKKVNLKGESFTNNKNVYDYTLELQEEVISDKENNWYVVGQKKEENKIAKTIIDDMSSLYNSALSRLELDSLHERLGEIRNYESAHGIWFKSSFGEMKSDISNSSFKNNYNTMQVGYDQKTDLETGNNFTGFSVSHKINDIDYIGGTGNNKNVGLSIYNTLAMKDDSYIDLIARYTYIDAEYKTFGSTVPVNASYNTWAGTLSAEYGKKYSTGNSNWFMIPHTQLNYTFINGQDYSTNSDIKVEQLGINSLIGRLGIYGGKDFKKSSHYLKVSVLREFMGDYESKITGADASLHKKLSGKDTWAEVGIGGDIQLGNRGTTNVYYNLKKTFGSDFEVNWEASIGLRVNFNSLNELLSK